MCRQSEAASLRHVVVWSCLIGRTGNISLSHHIPASCLRRFLSEVTQKWVAVMIRAGRTLQTLRKATSHLQHMVHLASKLWIPPPTPLETIKHPRQNWQNRWDSGKITMDKLILNGLWGEWRSPVHRGSQGGWRGRGGYGDFSNKGEDIPSCVIPNHHTAFPFKSLTMGCFLYAGLKLLTTADYEL